LVVACGFSTEKSAQTAFSLFVAACVGDPSGGAKRSGVPQIGDCSRTKNRKESIANSE
jgi:hypothetical protein